MIQTTTKLLSTLLLLVSVIATPAWAITLGEAKTQGLVGETPSGYLASVHATPNSNTLRLMNDINAKRKAAYTKSAKKAGVTLKVMEVRIGQRLYDRASQGSYVQKPNGQWLKK
ncbi:YdbL family protein [Neptunomonas japonica]|uniref:YdbL family protein n=1 Tax=Neptunomonas japonica TaxID=417574 RepID=UPI00041AF634|nr:YdbL family protein [Neptunomonas japonica]